MKRLIAVNGQLYTYISYDKNTDLHTVEDVDIDEDGILTATGITWYLTDNEMQNRGIELTEKQWRGLIRQYIAYEYELSEEEMSQAVEDILQAIFMRIPMVEELDRYVYFYMNRGN